MKKIFKIVGIVLLVLFFGMIIWGGISEYYHEIKQRNIIGDLRLDLAKQIKLDNTSRVPIRGKVLVWDLLEDEPIKGVWNKLPSHLNTRHDSDGPLTIYMVRITKQAVGEYSVSHETAFRQLMDVYIAYWPEKQIIGSISIVSNEPPKYRKADNKPEYGDLIEPIVNLILNMDKRRI